MSFAFQNPVQSPTPIPTFESRRESACEPGLNRIRNLVLSPVTNQAVLLALILDVPLAPILDVLLAQILNVALVQSPTREQGVDKDCPI